MYNNNSSNSRWTPPANYKDVEPAQSDFQRIDPGVYVCEIKNVTAKQSKNGNEMFVVEFDIAQGECANYYYKQWERNKNSGGQWRGVYRQMTGAEGNEQSISFFKGFIKALEDGNNANWDFSFDWFKRKLFAGLFGEEEYLDKNGSLKTACKLMYVRDISRINEYTAPEIKRLAASNGGVSGSYGDYPASYKEQSVQFSEIQDDQLPF
ncbi:MAG: hypothetical protein LBT88_08130 [Oscillospiraceae bacterium]|jgi:hypothetical protein|nr:hypothetical protein [Oscillospiraceae bacterium]